MNVLSRTSANPAVTCAGARPIIESELNEAYEPAEQLFPPTLPYCDVDLTPKFAYDAEKADWLCSEEGTTNDRGGGSKKKKSSNKKEETLYATLFGIAAGILALLACGVCYMASKERKGEPLFAPKPASNPMRDDLEKA